jgi:hypothetical protein
LKGFLLLLVFAVAGLAGVFYWRQSLQARSPQVAAAPAKPAKEGKERRRRRRGVRRLARNEVVAAAAPAGEAASGEGESPSAVPRSAPPEEPAPLAPGGSATTEVPPEDVFGALSPSSPAPAPSGARRQAVPEPEPVKLRPGDLKMVWQGEDLSQADSMRVDFSKDDGGRELSQDEIDTRFRAKEAAVVGCVTRAHPDAYTYVPGRVTVRFRIQRTGAVKGVQVEAPVILHKGGLIGCIRGVVGSLRFPASNGSQVISYPFSLM